MSDEPQDPRLLRVTMDIVTDGQLSEARKQEIALEVSNNAHVLLLEKEDDEVRGVNKFYFAHEHDAYEDRCGYCYNMSRDGRNGQQLANGEF